MAFLDVRIQDREALAAVSPATLAAYARAAGWTRTEPYGAHADVYRAEGGPDIVVPRTRRVGDYALVVSRLVAVFAAAAKTDELAIHRDLTTADRDVVRIAAATGDGTASIDDGVALLAGARDLLLAVAGSPPGAEAAGRLGRMRFGPPERDRFAVTVETPPIRDGEDTPERGIVRRLAEALQAASRAVEGAASGDDGRFPTADAAGSSADLCEALAAMTEPFPTLDVRFRWAMTREPPRCRGAFRFASGDVPTLRQAALSLRRRQHPA